MTTGGMHDLTPLGAWESLASGVWRSRFGETARELAYTSLAARGPRLAALDALPARPFPFTEIPGEMELPEEEVTFP